MLECEGTSWEQLGKFLSLRNLCFGRSVNLPQDHTDRIASRSTSTSTQYSDPDTNFII